MILKYKTRIVNNRRVISVLNFDGKWISLMDLAKTEIAVKNKLSYQSILERIRKRGKEIRFLDGILCNRRDYQDRIYEHITVSQYISMKFLTQIKAKKNKQLIIVLFMLVLCYNLFLIFNSKIYV